MKGNYPVVSDRLPSDWSPRLFLDLEFSGDRPTVLGVSINGKASSVPWSLDAASWLNDYIRPGTQVIGHSILTADKPILERELGFQIDCIDTMIWHYLCNAELCK